MHKHLIGFTKDRHGRRIIIRCKQCDFTAAYTDAFNNKNDSYITYDNVKRLLYLLHIAEPNGEIWHYAGTTTPDRLEDRLREHCGEISRNANSPPKAALQRGAQVCLAAIRTPLAPKPPRAKSARQCENAAVRRPTLRHLQRNILPLRKHRRRMGPRLNGTQPASSAGS